MQNLDALMDIPVRGKTGDFSLPLRQIASVKEGKGYTEMNHVNLVQVVDVFIDAQGRDIGSVARDVQAKIDALSWPNGMRAEIRGELTEMTNTAKSLSGGFVLAAVLVYLILAVQFESFLLPLILLATLPMGLSGIGIMLKATGTYFSIQAGMGAIFLIGIAVANGVLLIEFVIHQVQHARRDQELEAILDGAALRLRPILMTSLASMLGLVPMALGLGHGAEPNVPLGRAVIGGQFVATFMTLYLVPVLYRAILPRLGQKFRGREREVLPDIVSQPDRFDAEEEEVACASSN
jgi:multidrug efflux pump subunit AcrB